MRFSKLQIGEELKNELKKGFNIERISNWAFELSNETRGETEKEVVSVLNSICLMEMGPEFEYSEQELKSLADKLIADGKKEELSKPIQDIKDKAKELDGIWLMCPLCQEAWEEHSGYGMVCCPKCNNKLHNPRYKF